MNGAEALADLLHPRAVRRVWESGLVHPGRLPAVLRSVPWLLGRGPSLGVVSRMNAAAFGTKEALSDRSGTLTWGELDARAERFATALEGSGLAGGGGVATLLRNGREIVEVVLGAQKVGTVAHPLNTWAKPKELAAALEGAAPGMLVYDALSADQLRPVVPDGVQLIHVGDPTAGLEASVPYESLLQEHDDGTLAPVALRRGSTRIVIHTSGTTGRPKGAARRTGLGELAAFFGLLSVVPYRRDDVVFCPAPLFHSFGLLTATVAILLGATLVLPERFDPEETLAGIEYHRATAASLVPVMIRRILSLPREAKEAHDLSTLRIVLASGSALSDETRRQARELFGEVLYDLYGSTEAGWVAIATPEDMARHPGTVGRPVPGVDVAVLSPEGQRLPPGETGRLHVAAGATFEGYTTGEERGPEGAVSLGDLGRLDGEGYLFVEGRADDMVVVGGENVYPTEVEEVIQGVDGVEDVAVFGVEDPEYGQVLAAFVVGSADPDAVRDACRQQLASFKVPRRVEVVDELPRTPSGKVRKRDLLD